jgi:hypothetical protein
MFGAYVNKGIDKHVNVTHGLGCAYHVLPLGVEPMLSAG